MQANLIQILNRKRLNTLIMFLVISIYYLYKGKIVYFYLVDTLMGLLLLFGIIVILLLGYALPISILSEWLSLKYIKFHYFISFFLHVIAALGLMFLLANLNWVSLVEYQIFGVTYWVFDHIIKLIQDKKKTSLSNTNNPYTTFTIMTFIAMGLSFFLMLYLVFFIYIIIGAD